MESPHDKYVAFVISSNGNDWRHVRVWDLKSNKTMPNEELKGQKFSGIDWLDDRGFLYNRFAKPSLGEFSGYDNEKLHYNSIWYHRIGTPEESDVRIFNMYQLPYHILRHSYYRE